MGLPRLDPWGLRVVELDPSMVPRSPRLRGTVGESKGNTYPRGNP
jgi:hypothetical protein